MDGATTLSIMTFSIMTLNLTVKSVTQNKDAQRSNIQQNDQKHYVKCHLCRVSWFLKCYASCHYAECHNNTSLLKNLYILNLKCFYSKYPRNKVLTG
jgi:hypothetical protein